MADWSMLPSDVLGQIALKLDQLDDFMRFSGVCHSWNHASSLVKSIWNANVVMPWLLLAESTNENPDFVRKVYNLSNNKCYRFNMPETFGARCWGSSYGWITLQTFDNQVHLFNPLTKVRITSLPSILTLPKQPNDDPQESDNPDLEHHDADSDSDDSLEVQQDFFDFFVVKIVVLKMPRNRPHDDDDGGGDDLLIVAIYGEYDYLAFACLGDRSWTDIDTESNVYDVACRGDRIYIVRCHGHLSYCDIKGCDDLKDVKVIKYAPSFISQLHCFDKVYLLDLCGDLVMVLRSKIDLSRYNYRTAHFDVYRLDNKFKKWVTIEDIGNFSIFVGHHSSKAIPASVVNNCVSNCIYFTDDENVFWRLVPGFGGNDMGVYDIGSGEVIKQFYQGDATRSPFCPPIFFLPKCLLNK